jgi:hypothetical protein
MTESTQNDDYAAPNRMNNRTSSGMLSIQEEAPSNRLSRMSDITLPSDPSEASTLMCETTESTQEDDYAAPNRMNNRTSSGMLSIQEEAHSNRLSRMSDITISSEEF